MPSSSTYLSEAVLKGEAAKFLVSSYLSSLADTRRHCFARFDTFFKIYGHSLSLLTLIKALVFVVLCDTFARNVLMVKISLIFSKPRNLGSLSFA